MQGLAVQGLRWGLAGRLGLSLLALGLLALVLGAGCKPWHSRPCLSGDDRRANFVRRGWHDAHDESADWRTRICATEGVITRHHGGDNPDAPACIGEILEHFGDELLDSKPVAYDRLQLARLVGVTKVSQTTTYMTAKGEALIRLAALRQEDLADYRMLAGEQGPPLDKAAFRRLALAGLANTHLAMNRKPVLKAALARRNQPADAMERRILYPIVALHFENTLWGHPRHAVDNGSFALFDRILAETQAALERPYEEIEHGLLLDHIALLSFHAKRFGREQVTLDLLRHVVARAALVPAVEGRSAARRDLYVAAAIAEAECSLDHDGVKARFGRFYEEPPRGINQLLHHPVLYERGFDCRGRSATEMLMPSLLERLEDGTLAITSPPDQELSQDARTLLGLLVKRPREVVARPALRALLLSHPRLLQKRMRTTWYRHDPLVPLHLAVASSAPDDPQARALLRQTMADIEAAPYPDRLSRELLLAARLGSRFGLEDEIRALGEALAERAGHADASQNFQLAEVGLRASLVAASWAQSGP